MRLLHRCVRQRFRHYPNTSKHLLRCQSLLVTHETDSFGLPVKPTWSVNELLNSYPSPSITPATLGRLYELSALIPPEEGSPAHAKITHELEQLVRLVEAVRLVDAKNVTIETRLMGHHEYGTIETPEGGAGGRELLKHAARTKDGFYVIDMDQQG